MREFLEAATDSSISEHSAVMTAIEDLGTRISDLDDLIASSEAHTPVDAPPPTPLPVAPTPPPVAVRPAGSVHLPVPTDWGHNFYPTDPQPPAPLHSPASGLRVERLMPAPQVERSRHLAPSIRLGVRGP